METHTPTPRPWHTRRGEIVGNGDLIAGTSFFGQELSEQDIANAHHIVKCVNGWDEQQSKIEELTHAIGQIFASGQPLLTARVIRLLQTALTRAKGE